MQETLSQLIAWIREASPLVWGIAMRQVYVGVVMNFVWMAVFATGISALLALARYCRRGIAKRPEYHDEDWYTEGLWVSIILAIVSVFPTVITLCCAISGLLNPEWYAIELLLGQIK